MKTLYQHPVFKTGLYYLIVAPVLIYVMISGKFGGGPCNPGTDLLSFLLAGLISIMLFIINVILFIRRGGRYLPSAFLHFVAIIVWVLYISGGK